MLVISDPTLVENEKTNKEITAFTAGKKYLILPMELSHLVEDIPLIFRINQWLQHDGAPPHFSRNMQGILNRIYPNRWPARSPNLNPLDFSYGGT
jgi:hypothetical protein